MSFETLEAWEMAPCDVLALEKLPDLDTYLDRWFEYCSATHIDYAPPRIKVTQDAKVCKAYVWFPELGICQLGVPSPAWEVKEQFASMGHYTHQINFWDLELLIPAHYVSAHLQTLLSSSYQHTYSAGIPREFSIISEHNAPLLVHSIAQLHQVHSTVETMGVLCVIERKQNRSYYWYGNRPRRSLQRHRCTGEESAHHYLLSHTIMTQAVDVIASDRTMRMFDV